MNATDAVEFLLAGASAVQVGTANFMDPQISIKIIQGIKEYMNRKGIKTGVAGSIIVVKTLVFQAAMLGYALICACFTWFIFGERIVNFAAYMLFGAACNLIFIVALMLISSNERLTMKITEFIVSMLHKLKIIKNYNATFSAAAKQIRLFEASLSEAGKNLRVTIFCLVITLIQLSAFYIIPYCIYRALQLSGSSVFLFISANAIITMITAFIPLPGGSGAAEGSFYIFFAMFFSKPILPLVILIWRIMTYYSCLIFGALVSLLRFKKKAAFATPPSLSGPPAP